MPQNMEVEKSIIVVVCHTLKAKGELPSVQIPPNSAAPCSRRSYIHTYMPNDIHAYIQNIYIYFFLACTFWVMVMSVLVMELLLPSSQSSASQNPYIAFFFYDFKSSIMHNFLTCSTFSNLLSQFKQFLPNLLSLHIVL